MWHNETSLFKIKDEIEILCNIPLQITAELEILRSHGKILLVINLSIIYALFCVEVLNYRNFHAYYILL